MLGAIKRKILPMLINTGMHPADAGWEINRCFARYIASGGKSMQFRIGQVNFIVTRNDSKYH